MPYTMEDFKRELFQDYFARLPPQEYAGLLLSLPAEELAELLRSLPLEVRLAGLSEAEIRQFLNRRAIVRGARPGKRRRKKSPDEAGSHAVAAYRPPLRRRRK